MITNRDEARNKENASRLADATFIYLAGGEPGYLASTLRDTAAWEAILEANRRGAPLAGSSAGAMALCDPMLVPGSGPQPGLGLFQNLIVLPHHDLMREGTMALIEGAREDEVRFLGIDECTGLVLDEMRCLILGPGSVTMYARGRPIWSKQGPAEMKEVCI